LKRAQITAFILLGVVVVSVFGGIFIFAQITTEQQIKQQVNLLTTDLLQTTALEYYISSCLEEATNEALVRAAEQGGILYEDSSDDEDVIEKIAETKFMVVDGQKVNYGIYNELETDNDYGYYTPNAKIDDVNNLGDREFPRICDKKGPNNPSSSLVSTCDVSSYGGILDDFTLQELLSFYIANRSKKCLDLDVIRTKFNYELVEKGKPSVDVLYGEDDVLVKLNYPFEFSLPDQEPFLKNISLDIKKNVRIKKVFELAAKIVDQEIKKFDFDFLKDHLGLKSGKNTLLWDNFIDVQKSKIGSDYLIYVTDSRSLIKGQELGLKFAVKNRPPILDLIQGTAPGGAWASEGFHYVVNEGDEIVLEPKAVDPDGDELEFELETVSGGIVVDEWVEVEYNVDTGIGPIYTLNTMGHVGDHEVKFSVKEEGSSVKDWQNIKFKILDVPIVKAFGHNIFNDIPTLSASIEDPFILNSSESKIPGRQNVEYNWRDLTEFFDISGKIAIVPPVFDIMKMDNLPFEDVGDDLASQSHEIQLTVKDSVETLGTEIFNVEVYPCLPHKSNLPSYPFIKLHDEYDETNPYMDFLGDHSCCVSGATETNGKNILVFIKGDQINKYEKLENLLEGNGFSVDLKTILPGTLDAYDQVWVVAREDTDGGENLKLNRFNKRDKNSIALFVTTAMTKYTPLGYETSTAACRKVNEISQNHEIMNSVSPTVFNPVNIETIGGFTNIITDGTQACINNVYAAVRETSSNQRFQKKLIDGSVDRLINENLENENNKEYLVNVANWLSRLNQEVDTLQWGTIANEDTVCFQDDRNSCYPFTNPEFEGDDWRDIVEANEFETLEIISNNEKQNKISNDIYKRTFTQKCGGDRGNVCTGKVIEKYNVVNICPDKKSGEDESCFGPCAPGNDECNVNTCPGSGDSKVGGGCYAYGPGESFEKSFLKDPNADGICNEAYEYEKSGSLYQCNAQCGGPSNRGCTKRITSSCECKNDGDNAICDGISYLQRTLKKSVNGGTCKNCIFTPTSDDDSDD